jgi:hypothetical protein
MWIWVGGDAAFVTLLPAAAPFTLRKPQLIAQKRQTDIGLQLLRDPSITFVPPIVPVVRRFATISLFLFTALTAVMCKRTAPVDEGKRFEVQRGPVKFSITEVEGLMYLVPDSVKWVMEYTRTDSITGPVLMLYKPSLTFGMNEPHIRMDYVSKKAHSSATVEEVFAWLKDFYQEDGRASQVVNDKETVTTLDGQEVRLLEFFKPEHLNSTGAQTVTVAAKRVAYAYIDSGNGYWIGTSLSVAGDQSEYDSMMERFRLVVASFRAGQHS